MRKFIHLFLMLLFFGLCVKFNVNAGTISPELLDALKAAKPDQNIDVIVILADQVDTKTLAETKTRELKDKRLLRTSIITALKTKADETQLDLKTFLKDNKATKAKPYWIVNSIAATVRADIIPELARRPEVAEVRLDFVILLADPIPATAAAPEWNLELISVPELWNLGFTGQGIVVANMDTGVDVNHNDLIGRWRGGNNSWLDPNLEHVAGPFDDHGHGTQTMGILVGGDATGTAIGVAPDAQWIAVKIFNDAGEASVDSIRAGFQWLLDPDSDSNTDDAPDIVNNSWGYRSLVDICYLEFQQEIQTLKASEIAVIFSAGNEGPGLATSISPANNPESFAVGAVDQYQSIASLSSRGPSACVVENDVFPEVVAPGISIKTSDRTFGFLPDASAIVSGTSFAAPHVAGAMALLQSAFPAATIAELEAALRNTALDLGDIGPDNDYGDGLIDVMAAYRSLVPCTNADMDGYYAETVCGTAPDCDDSDDSIYPGALEQKHDGIDQDCNDYDLTIDILSAKYFEIEDQLCVTASSSLGENADLVLVGYPSYPAMIWNPAAQQWRITVHDVAADPGLVIVQGIEGTETAGTTVEVHCKGDLDGDGDVDVDDLGGFAAAFGNISGIVNYDAAADFNGDGDVDAGDLAIFISNYGSTNCPICPL
jgi:serine protease AprX